mmetsp:Transcript_27144/g.51106  ORF Transcript_27144/g.51106 Transcript_27144/m.51106 type:complete len:517 (-) Transcript_27144:182-1732(-)
MNRFRSGYDFRSDYEEQWECKHCLIEGTLSEISSHGPHHRIAQGCFRWGFVAEHDGRMACPRAEGSAFKCGKYNCPCEMVVLWGFVWHLSPDIFMRFAGRGPHHTVRSGCRHHDYWCDMNPNGMRAVAQVVQQENAKAKRIFSDVSKHTEDLVHKFSIGAGRLVQMLPEIEKNMILELGCPALSLPDAPDFPGFHDHASYADCEKALSQHYNRQSEARSALHDLVTRLHIVHCLQGQLSPQRMAGRKHCLDTVLAFLGRASLLPRISGFVCKELEAPPVIDEVQHSEPAAAIDEQMGSMNLEHKLADNLTALNDQDSKGNGMGHDANFEVKMEQIHLLEYHRHPEAFRKALCEGPPLQQCRAALEESGCKWLLGSGAKIFVHPHQYSQTLVAIVEQGFELRPFHVIVAESFEYYVEACLSDLSYRQGARVKHRTRLLEVDAAGDEGTVKSKEWQVFEDSASDEEDSEEPNIPLVIKKTFICVAPCRRNPQSVTQSTTEVHSGGMNPRRVCVSSFSG